MVNFSHIFWLPCRLRVALIFLLLKEKVNNLYFRNVELFLQDIQMSYFLKV